MHTIGNHISVCVCTYKRPNLLEKLLKELENQETEQLFSFSIVVVDNDYLKSAKNTVKSFKENSKFDVEYYIEPEQNIALARNRAVENAQGNYIAFIDDDEFPTNKWLINLYKTCNKYNVDGVLGPVKPHFEKDPPRWIIKGKLFERPSHQTGFVLQWKHTRTGNVLLKRHIFKGENRFDKKYLTGEDRDFFKRMIEKGYIFIWCNEAPVYETVPPGRWKRTFMLRKALMRGKISLRHPSFGVIDILKSIIAFPVYTLALPVLFLVGHHIFMKYLVKDFDHIGRLLACCGLEIVKGKYILE